MRRTFKTRIDPAEILLKVSTRYLLVGKCDNRFAGLAKFLPTKVVYAFEHPTHRQVEMHMAYKDMIGVRTQDGSLRRVVAHVRALGGGRGGGGARAEDVGHVCRGSFGEVVGGEASHHRREAADRVEQVEW